MVKILDFRSLLIHLGPRDRVLRCPKGFWCGWLQDHILRRAGFGKSNISIQRTLMSPGRPGVVWSHWV